MNYTFPIIKNINDVIPHIKDYEEITINEKNGYKVIKYMISTPQLWEWNDDNILGCSIRRECRGLIFDANNGEILARPWHKFFNVNEKPETQIDKINLYDPHVILEKLDGSCIFAFKLNNELKLASKAGETEVSAMASNFLRNHSKYYDFMNYMIDNYNCTPIFEFCSRKNRVVIDYPEDRLVLTGIRNNINGKYVRYTDMVYYAQLFGIDYVKAIDTLSNQNIHLFVKQVKDWEDSEGIVLRFNTGHMIKIKADDYILRHHAKESINHEKNLIALILNDGLDDLLPVLFESDRERVIAYERAFHVGIHDTAMLIHDMYNEYKGDGSQKDFAVNFVSHKEKKYHQFLYNIHKGDYNLLNALYKYIGSNLSSSTRVDSVRWIFNNINWHFIEE